MSREGETMREITTTTGVLLSITTGRLLCDFGDMHEAADVLAGQPLVSHQFASQRLSDQMEAEAKRQHPWTADPLLMDDFPDMDSIPQEDRKAAIEGWLEEAIYPRHGRTCVLTSPPETRHVPLAEGLPAKFGGGSW